MKTFIFILALILIICQCKMHHQKFKKHKQFFSSYAMASDGGNNLASLQGYSTPQMVGKLADVIVPPSPGPLESVDEIPTNTNYYDGSLNLNMNRIDCHLITVPNECYIASTCGWCGSANVCIRGSTTAPLEYCGSQYLFSRNFRFHRLMSKQYLRYKSGLKKSILMTLLRRKNFRRN